MQTAWNIFPAKLTIRTVCYRFSLALLAGIDLICLTNPLLAQNTPLFSYEIELEFGYEIAGANSLDERRSEAFLATEFALAFALTDRLSVFADFSAESAHEKEYGPSVSTASFELEQLGIRYAWRSTDQPHLSGPI